MTEAAVTPPPPSEDKLKAYYEEHKTKYSIQSGATFTHVFVSSEGKSREQTETEAINLLKELRETNASFEDAVRYGDRFLFHTNYVERTYAYIQSHFGAETTKLIFSQDTPLNEWKGPFWSEYGAHLVYVTGRSPARTPSFEEIHDRLSEDYIKDVQRKQLDALIEAIIAEYSPEVRLELSDPGK